MLRWPRIVKVTSLLTFTAAVPALLPLFAQPQPPQPQEGWWMREPIRWVQTNLRQTDANLDAARLMQQLADMRANVVLMGMGGIAAYYPTAAGFHYPSPDLPPGRDMFGDVVREAHARKIRVVGRYDLSKTPKPVFDAHPEWFFRQSNGEPVIYNGLYSTCINGDWYRGQVMKILAEGLDKYAVDGLFFNMFGNQSRDYSGKYVGLCHCDACQRKYRQLHNRAIPETPDDDYRRFMFTSSREVAAAIGELIKTKRPQAGYFNYIQEYTDGIMSESNTAVDRPLPLWPYSASDRVNRARNSQPGKMAINLNMQFVDYAWRFATVPREEIRLRAWQNIAHGGALTFEVNGTLDLQDRQALEAVKPVFRWVAEHEQFYVRQSSAARVLLLGAPSNAGRTFSEDSYRGVFRMLSEEHIPFSVADNLDWIGKREFDLVIATDWAPKELNQYKGRILVLNANPPEFPSFEVRTQHKDVKGYIRVRLPGDFPSVKETSLLLLNGPFTEALVTGPPSLTLVPPSMFGPPEFIHIDMKDTNVPAIVKSADNKQIWIPWNLGTLYHRLSLPAHKDLFRDLVAALLPERQIRTNAHPLVELILMRQGNRTMLHLVNLSGHSQTGYFAPIRMTDISIELEGNFRSAKAQRTPAAIAVNRSGRYSKLLLPSLNDYELIVLE